MVKNHWKSTFMKMQKRTNLVMQFSSFLCLKEESSSLITYWKITPELEQNMRQLLDQQEILAEEDDLIAQEFLEWLRDNQDNLKKKHLIAYLQESCFFATKKVYQRFKNCWNIFTWQDYFQWANLLLASPTKLLAKYNQSLRYKLTTYARSKIESQLIDRAYQYMGWERASDWGLLRQLKSGTRKKCLQIIGGLKDSDLEKYLLVWECFNVVYSSKTIKKNQKLPPPSANHFLKITQEYNFIVKNKGANLPNINQEECNLIISNCIEFARQYCSPKILNSGEYTENLVDQVSVNVREEKELQKEEYNQVDTILTNAFYELDLSQKILFELWKGLQLTQTEIAEIMGVNYGEFVREQYQVTRQINSTRQELLEKLVREILADSQITITKQKFKELKNPLDQWLQEYCKEVLSQKITEIYQLLSDNEKSTIMNNFQEKNFTDSDTLNHDLNPLAKKLKTKLIEDYQLFFPETNHINLCFVHLVEDWFINNYPNFI
ncbi:hypothetical protein CSQ80_05955 [Cyanobacterium aponinum IPPAS B-1201]|nr:hypothetical protein CSQ80_05955 [Cyanobacterium aponinum IPPAS B-1201]